ncbi:MAG: phosphocholine cytidylyltransferase family protein [Rhodospirillales bacterium]
MEQSKKIKAIILAAGVGSRIRPLTDNCPKCMLKIRGVTILERMLMHIQACGINEVVFVLGYLQEQIKVFVKKAFPELDAHFIVNDRYTVTNTGYSLMLTEDFVKGSSFVKFDADVVFDKKILKNILASDDQNVLCIDKEIHLDETAILLFAELKVMMAHEENHQEYYEAAYEQLMKKDVPFHALDITGLKWTEIDTKQDFDAAEKIFV